MAKSKSTAAAAALPATIPTVTKDAPILLELLAAANSNKAMAENFIIDSPEMYDIAAITLKELREVEVRCEAEKKKISEPQYDAWKATNALFNPLLKVFETAKKQLGQKMVKYEDAEKAKRDAAERTAVVTRQQDIAEAEAKLAAATQALADGTGSMEAFEEANAAVMMAEVSNPLGAAVADPVSRGGHSRRNKWVGEINDLPLFLEWIAKRIRLNDPLFDNTIEIKYGQINSFGTDTEGTGKIPGVVFHDESSIAARR